MSTLDFDETLEEFLTELTPIHGAWTCSITDSYSEMGRCYHTLQHVRSMWDLWTALRPDGWTTEDDLTIKLSIIFHDFIYDPRAKDNELKSARIFEDFSKSANLNSSITKNVTNMILATIKHKLPEEPYHPKLPLFLDLDLEVLARPREAYATYASQIRQEYAHVPDEAFREGRSAVLKHLSEGEIYFTVECKERWTAKAKENIAWELERLSSASVLV